MSTATKLIAVVLAGSWYGGGYDGKRSTLARKLTACAHADKWNKRFTLVSAALWAIGFFAAFLLPRL